MIRIVESTDREAVQQLLSPSRVRDKATERRAATIVERVRHGGDAALLRYAQTLDGLHGPAEVDKSTWADRAQRLDPALARAIKRAARRIRRVAAAQVPRAWRIRVALGLTVEQRVIPLDRVGCYVPGGRYPLPSSLLMTAIPARVAGVRHVVAVCPRVDDVMVAAAMEAKVDRLFCIGGAHAVAALAYGTATVPRVDKIVGPGNRWVSAAKAIVSRDCAIDFYAGPTEIVIVTATGPATWIAADMVAQAEHDPDARAVLITSNRALAVNVARRLEAAGVTSDAARESLVRHGGAVVTRSMQEAIALANEVAPEHLVVGTETLASQVRSAGAVFVGRWSAQVAGDYAIGSNHVLPTAGGGRSRGGLSAADFVRLVSVQRLTREGLTDLADTITTLARAEGLEGHAASIDIRVPPQQRGGAPQKMTRR